MRNLYLAVTGIVAGSLFAVGLVMQRYSDIGEGWRLVASVCCVFGAVGVIWLGWYWLKLTRGITSIAEQLKGDNPSYIKLDGNTVIGKLGEAINSRFGGNVSYIAELESQIKDLQIKIQLLRGQKGNTEAIIYSIRDAVIVVDEFDKLLMANEAASKLFDFDFKSSKHKDISEVIDADKAEFVDFLRQSRQSKARATRREITIADSGGRIADSKRLNAKEGTFDCIVSCVYDEQGRVRAVVAVLHDITRDKEISQMKNDFVSQVSHELKTPLASIAAYSEMLVDGEAEDDKTRKEFYSVIQSQAKRLNRLIENLLNISRIESGLIKVKKGPISLTMLIEEQLQMMKSCAKEKNISLSWGNIGSGSEEMIVFGQVYADKDMISQVIINLLSNAVKYTRPGGSIRIETEVDEIAGLARVSITDTGVGIEESELEHIFDKFYRVGASKGAAKGTGLGLNLVKQIVERVHDGRMFVTSEPGVGSTFGFELPLMAHSNSVERIGK